MGVQVWPCPSSRGFPLSIPSRGCGATA
jgi:hypothetical protein